MVLLSNVGFPAKEVVPADLGIELRHDFNFLCVAQLGPRKNVEAVLNNFIEEFQNEEVGLVFKINGANDSVMDYHGIKNIFNDTVKILKKEGHKCSINLLHGNLTDEQMHGLYANPKIKAMVSFTHGEGFGLPLYEAAYSGLPVIATNWSGHLDFLTMEKKTPVNKVTNSKKHKISTVKKVPMFAAVKFELVEIPPSAVWKGVLTQGSKWAKIDDADSKKKMRDVFKSHTKWEKKAIKLAKTYEGSVYWYDRFNTALAMDSIKTKEEVVE